MKKILAIVLALTMVFAMSVSAYAAPVAEATIDMTRLGSVQLWKYDLTNAEKDGVWDSSYVSTGVRDENGVEKVLGGGVIRYGDNDDEATLGNEQVSHGYAIKGVEFTYLRIAIVDTYTKVEDGKDVVKVLYGIKVSQANKDMLQAIGVEYADRYVPADRTEAGETYYFFESDTLINGLRASLEANATTVKNALENYVKANGGTAMTETDAYGYTHAEDMPLGLYLFVETRVPEMVTDTTDPFLVAVPMTSVDGTNATDGGTRWIYDIALYPKNLTGIPSLEKTVRETKADTGKNNNTAAIDDGFAHTGTASAGDTVEYQIISTLPSITSAATYLTTLQWVDSLSDGITYNKDVSIVFYKDEACTQVITSWVPVYEAPQINDKVQVSYSTNNQVMTVKVLPKGLEELNSIRSVYTGADMVNSGYSDCTVRIRYTAKVDSTAEFTYGDEGNDNKVVLTWQRTNSAYWDTLIDDCHIYSYGIDLLKTFSDDRGDYSKVEFLLHNDTDNYYVKAELNADEGVYYVVGHADHAAGDEAGKVAAEAQATHFIPMSADPNKGKIFIKGLEDDTYTLTEVRTDNTYALLKDPIVIVISNEEGPDCDIYSEDVLGLIQNDPRFREGFTGTIITTGGLANPLVNIPQKQLAHKLLVASATVDNNEVTMEPDGTSDHAFAPLKVVNLHTFDLPKTGGNGNWMFPMIGLGGFALCMFFVYMLMTKGKKKESNQ